LFFYIIKYQKNVLSFAPLILISCSSHV
jgi:hypothetical protein